jgi:hypothetical protein
MKKIPLILLFSAAVFLPLAGEVFLLRPLTGGGNAAAFPLCRVLPGLENASPLLTEPVRINGKNFTLELYRSNARFEDMRRFLVSRGVHFAESNDSLRCTARLSGDTLERLLVVKSPGRGPVTVFRIAGSAGLPPVSLWPPELPELPSGARALQVIELPRRSSVYGAFEKGSPDAQGSFRQIDAALSLAGWRSAGKEASPLTGGTGDIYIHNRTKNILWVTLDQEGRGAFYCRKMAK